MNSSDSMNVDRGKADPVAVLNSETMIHVLSFVEPVAVAVAAAWKSEKVVVPSTMAITRTVAAAAPVVDNNNDDDDIIWIEDEDGEDMMDLGVNDEDVITDDAILPRWRKQQVVAGYQAPKVRAFHSQMELVSPLWRALFLQRPIISQSLKPVGLALDFDQMSDAFEDRGIAWLRHYGMPIKSICCGQKKKHLFVLASKVLTECDTSELTHATVGLRLPDDSPAHLQFFSGESSFSSRGLFQQTLAKQCPKLKHLDLILNFTKQQQSTHMSVPRSVDEAIRNGPALFSHSAITSLSIHVAVLPNSNGSFKLEDTIINKLIQNLPCLRSLALVSSHDNLSASINSTNNDGAFVAGPFQINSNSLQVLDIKDFCTFSVRISLKNCPRLQHLYLTAAIVHYVRGDQEDLGLQIKEVVQRIVTTVNIPDSCTVHASKDKYSTMRFPLRTWQTMMMNEHRFN